MIVMITCPSQNGFSGVLSDEDISDIKPQIISRSMSEKEGQTKKERILIFEGDVHFKYSRNIDFFSDRLLISVSNLKDIDFYEMSGNVIMKLGEIQVSGQKAYSENLTIYIDFLGNAIFRKQNESPIHSQALQYNFINKTIRFLENDDRISENSMLLTVP